MSLCMANMKGCITYQMDNRQELNGEKKMVIVSAFLNQCGEICVTNCRVASLPKRQREGVERGMERER